VGEPEVDVVGKQDGECVNETCDCVKKKCLENKMALVITENYGWSEGDVVGKQDG